MSVSKYTVKLDKIEESKIGIQYCMDSDYGLLIHSA